jgi:uncharacterized protein (DUF934 family)
MSVIIKNRAIVQDTWQHLGDDEAIADDGAVTVSWARWQRERLALLARKSPIGVVLPNDVELEALGSDYQAWSLVLVSFPKFTDGRGYSLARLLRGRLGYDGELRAVGDIMRDQLYYLERCGFDAFTLKPGKDPVDALNGFTEFTVQYQPSSDEPLPLWRRHNRSSLAPS